MYKFIYPKFEKGKVLIVGDIMLDYYWNGVSKRISPEAPVPIINITEKEYKLGGAANVAANVKSLGSFAQIIGFKGNDNESIIVEGLWADDELVAAEHLGGQQRVWPRSYK